MCIIAFFLLHDVGVRYFSESFIELATDPELLGGGGNATDIEIDDGCMILSDLFPAKENLNPAKFKISVPTYIKLLEE